MQKIQIRFLSFILAVVTVFSCLGASSFSAAAKEYRVKLPDGRYRYVYTSDIAPSELRATRVLDQAIRLEWYHYDFDADYSGYQVLLYNPVTKKYKSLGYTKKQYYVVKNLKPSKVYTFVVRSFTKAYKGKFLYGKKSAKLSVATSPQSIQLQALQYSARGTITAVWEKAPNASGYAVQYSTSQAFKPLYTNTVFVYGKSRRYLEIGGLTQAAYYVRVAPFKSSASGKSLAVWSEAQTACVSEGLSLKEMINYYETDNAGRKIIYQLTENSVDIKRYSTTYDKMKAIYDWHAKHGLEFEHCLACNANFNRCIDALFGETRKYDNFIWIDAGDYINNSGEPAMHKWSVLSFGGMPYIFDPRIQSYTGDYTGDLYFGIPYKAEMWYRYDRDYWYCYWREGISKPYYIIP